MQKNIGSIDKILRILLGLTLILLAVFNIISWWGYIGIIPLVTALINFCPLYRILGISTCKKC